MANRRDLEKRLAKLREDGDDSGDGVELTVTVRDEVIPTPWEPEGDAEAPTAGTTVTDYSINYDQ